MLLSIRIHTEKIGYYSTFLWFKQEFNLSLSLPLSPSLSLSDTHMLLERTISRMLTLVSI